MKTKFIIALAILSVGFLSAFKLAADRSVASVDQQQGLYIFILSKPVTPSEYLGSVKKGIALTGGPGEMLNSMVKKVKKEYPTADGIIFTSLSMDKADAVKFKE